MSLLRTASLLSPLLCAACIPLVGATAPADRDAAPDAATDAGVDVSTRDRGPAPTCPAPTGRPAGVRDPASPGEQTLPPSGNYGVNGVAADGRGGVLAYGTAYCRGSATDYDGAVWRLTAEGVIDLDFGVNGVACVGRVPGAVRQDAFHDLAVDPLGRIVAVGISGDAGLVVRLDSYGAPDRSFGEGGALRIAIPLSSWEQTTMSFAAVIAEAGRIVIAGANAGVFSPNNLGFVLALTDDGTLDPAFNRGRVWFDPSAVGYYALERDGNSYLAAGSDRTSRHGRVARLGLDGSLIPDFGASGISVLPRPDAFMVQSMVLGDGGSIVLAGAFDPDAGNRVGAPPALMARLDARGALDEGFMPGNPALPVRWNIGYQFRSSLARQCDGRLLLTSLSSNAVRLSRFTADGALDPTFSDSAVVNSSETARPLISPVGVLVDPSTGGITAFTIEHDSRALGLWRFSP